MDEKYPCTVFVNNFEFIKLLKPEDLFNTSLRLVSGRCQFNFCSYYILKDMHQNCQNKNINKINLKF